MTATLVTKDTPTKTALLTALNGPAAPTDPQPALGLCDSAVTSSLCGKLVGPLKVAGGCATTKSQQCIPPELVAAKCVQPTSMAGFVTQHAPRPANAGTETIPRPGKPQLATFEGCCVVPKQGTTGSTCKKVRVGAKWRTSKTLVMNPLKQINSCQCFNLREYVARDMLTRPNRKAPNHVLAHYPFTAGLAAKVRPRGGSGCTLGPVVPSRCC